MKRDMDLIRTILMEIEAHEDPMTVAPIEARGFSPDQISYHVQLLQQAGLIEALDASSMDGPAWLARSLTWRGHEFLDATRNDTVWQKVKAEIKDRGASLPFSLLQQLAVAVAAKHLGLKP